MTKPSRTIIKEHEFEVQLKRIMPDARRADEFIAGAEWVLSRDPHEGMPLSDRAEVFLLFMRQVGEWPSVTIYYRFDDRYVYLMAIRLLTMGDG